MVRLAALGALIWLSACTTPASDAMPYRPDTAGRRDSVAAVAAASMGEPNVLALLAATHAVDSAVGALGAAQGSNREVTNFGRMILREHAALRRDALAVARDLGLTPAGPAIPPAEAPSELRVALDAIQPGVRWDRAYLTYADAVHQAALENTARALAATQRPEVRQLIEKSVPILQKHLDKARSLSRTLQGS